MASHLGHCHHLPEQRSVGQPCQSTAIVALQHHDHLQDNNKGFITIIVTIEIDRQRWKMGTLYSVRQQLFYAMSFLL